MTGLTKWNVIAALGALLIFEGCTTTLPQGVTPPEVNMVSFRLHEVRVLESDAIFVLRIDNDGPAPMTINGGVHKIFIDGVRIGKAQSSEQLQLPPFSSSTQEVLTHVSNLRFLTRFKGFVGKGSYDYRLQSKLYLSVDSGGSRPCNVTSEGRVDFNPVQPAMSPAAARLIESRTP